MLTPIFHLFKDPTEQEVDNQLMLADYLLNECTQYHRLSGNRCWAVMRLDSRQIILKFNQVLLREFGSKTKFPLGG